MKKIFTSGTILILVILVGIQLIPIDRTNPPVTREVQWNAPETRALAQRACFDCHSNESVWPWYGRIAPFSLLLYDHILEGRQRLNFSEWDRPNQEFEEVQKVMNEGEMPTWDYELMHPAARLSAAERDQLLSGLQATYQQDPPIAGFEREEK